MANLPDMTIMSAMLEKIAQVICRWLFWLLCAIGRPFGGIRPRRMCDRLGRLAYSKPEFAWVRNRWGAELYLTPFYHIDRNILAFGCYDPDLHRLLEQLLRPGMVCMDVGANLGEMTIHMAARVGSDGVVYSFEPVSRVRERLRKHVERNRVETIVRIIPAALSNQTGRTQIHCADASADNQGLASIVQPGSNALPLTEEVETMRLDDFVAREGVRRIDLMKVDIQGAEPFLLEGGARVFQTLSPDLLIEISPKDLRHARETSRDLIAKIEAYGYSVYRTRRGRIGDRIRAARVGTSFHAPNVFCTKRSHPAAY